MKELLKIYFKSFTKKYILIAILAILFMIGDVGIALLIPAITRNLITQVISGENNLIYVYQTGLTVIAIAFAAVLTTIFNNIFAQYLSTRITAELRQELFAKIQNLSFNNVDSITSGTLMTIVSNDTNQIQQIIMMSFRAILRSPLTLIGAIIMSYVLNKDLFFIVFLSVPILGFSILYIIKKAGQYYRSMQSRIDDLNTKLIETVSGAREIKSFVTSIEEKQRFEVVNENYHQAIVRANNIMSYMDPIIVLISNIAIGAVLIVSSQLAIRYTGNAKNEIVGNISAYISYLQQIIMSLMMLSMVAVQLSRGEVSAKRIYSVFDVIINIVNKNNAIKDLDIKGEIEFKNVSFGYTDDDGVNDGLTLRDINIKIKPKSTIGIIGSTGSGKTTLVQLIPRLYDVTIGELLIDGINVKDIDLKTLREQISYVTQEAIIFSGSVESNIRLGKKDATKEEIIQAAKNAVAYEYIEKFDKQFETEVTENGTNLSGGQKQRLSLARALVRKPKILILDDSTSAVDAKSEALIKENISSTKNQTTIIVAQKISSIRNCDSIIVLDNSGRLDGFGPHDKLLKDSKVYQEIYTSQFGGKK